jgi:hypothetical protein
MIKRLVLIGLLAALTGCGQAPGTSSERPASAHAAAGAPANAADFDVPAIDWDNPAHGEPVASLAAAQRMLPFVAQTPQGLGAPAALYLTPLRPGDTPDFLELEFIFNSGAYGRIVVIEHHPSLPSASEYFAYEDAMAALSGTPNTYGTAEIVQLAGGRRALLTATPDRTQSTINWYVSSPSGDYEVIIQGPTLTPDQAIAVANAF